MKKSLFTSLLACLVVVAAGTATTSVEAGCRACPKRSCPKVAKPAKKCGLCVKKSCRSCPKTGAGMGATNGYQGRPVRRAAGLGFAAGAATGAAVTGNRYQTLDGGYNKAKGYKKRGW